jgi:hypothetical protein
MKKRVVVTGILLVFVFTLAFSLALTSSDVYAGPKCNCVMYTCPPPDDDVECRGMWNSQLQECVINFSECDCPGCP